MTTVVVPATCSCGSLSPTVVMCSDHHRYFREGQELTSVSKVIRTCWPAKKVFDGADPAVLEHARDRGVRVDAYFSEYIRTGLVRIPAGEWQEVVVAVRALVAWWTAEKIADAEAQVILTNGTEAGTADIVAPRIVFDTKVVSQLDPTYEIQLGAYGSMKDDIEEGVLIHCKVDARNLTAKVTPVPVDMKQAVADWLQVRDVYRMAHRRTQGGPNHA